VEGKLYKIEKQKVLDEKEINGYNDNEK